jgi:hypothetical protein
MKIEKNKYNIKYMSREFLRPVLSHWRGIMDP